MPYNLKEVGLWHAFARFVKKVSWQEITSAIPIGIQNVPGSQIFSGLEQLLTVRLVASTFALVAYAPAK